VSHKPHIVSMVMNGVVGDSRVIKTAQVALNAGYRATILGLSSSMTPERKEVEGVPVILLPNLWAKFKSQGLWYEGSRDLRLLVGGHLQALIPEIVALDPDLLHSHDMIGLKLGAAAAQVMMSSGRSVPWVHDIHEFVAGLASEIEGTALSKAYMPVCLAYEREYLHKADHCFTVSEPLAAELESRYAIPRPTVCYNAPGKQSFDATGPDVRTTLGLSPETPLVVFVGGATPLRGCATIVEAVLSLEGVHLCFVSQGGYVHSLKRKASEQGGGDRVHLLPYVSSDKVSSFIRTADVGIHGMVHYPNGEVAMPNKMFEYLHARLPLVVSDVAAMKQFVTGNNIGTTFIAQNVTSCAEAIRAALDGASAFRARITDDLISEYSWESQEAKIRQVYMKLLEQPKEVSLAAREAALLAQRLDTIEFEALYSRHLGEANLKKIGIWRNYVITPTFIDRVRFLRDKVAEEGPLRAMQFVGSRVKRAVRGR